jgi:hypothetical protein
MSYFYEDGQMVFERDGRRVATTGGTLLQFMTEEQTFSTNLSFPDANKTELYQWQYRVSRFVGDNFSVFREAANAVGARPQEWSNTITLGSAPAGADLVMGRVVLTRTTAPSHAWLGQTITPCIPQGVQIGLAGATSLVLEMALGICRAVTFSIQSGQLVALLQHSVGPAAGNFGSNGVVPYALPPNSTSDSTRRGAINTCVGGGAALPVLYRNSLAEQQNYTSATSAGAVSGGQGFANRAQYGGADALAYSDPTNYASTYSLTARVRFGRRS